MEQMASADEAREELMAEQRELLEEYDPYADYLDDDEGVAFEKFTKKPAKVKAGKRNFGDL